MLKFEQPMTVVSKKPTDEGKIQAGRGKQIASMLLDGGAGSERKTLRTDCRGRCTSRVRDSDYGGDAFVFFQRRRCESKAGRYDNVVALQRPSTESSSDGSE